MDEEKHQKRLSIFSLLPLIFIIGFVIWQIYPVLPIPSGSVTGELVSYEIRPINYDLQTYPWTRIVLKNYTVNGGIGDWDNKFYFDGEYPEVDNLVIGNIYEFVYKQGSRPSDTTSGDEITQFYLLGINPKVRWYILRQVTLDQIIISVTVDGEESPLDFAYLIK